MMQKKRNIFFISIGLACFIGLSLLYVWTTSCKKSYDISVNKALEVDNLVPIVVLGSGPAGLTAAYYGARANITTLVIDGNKPGGALMETSYIENWPGIKKILGSELIQGLRDQARTFGVEFLADAVASIDLSSWPYTITTEGDKTIHALTVIIATGSTPKTLQIPGEKEFWGKGVTTCAVCDAPFHKDNDVVVIGGGDSAVEESLQLAPYAKTVTVLVRGNAMRAAASMQDRLKEVKNISVKFNSELVEIKGDDSGVTSVLIKNNKTNDVAEKKVTGVFLAIGHFPNTQLFKEQINLDSSNYIELEGRSQRTNIPGVFAAGDAADPHYKQAGVAAGNGSKAALDAVAFLQEHGFNESAWSVLAPKFFEPFLDERIDVPVMTSVAQLKNVLQFSKGPVLVDFYAHYCPSCMQMLPAIESVASQFEGQATFVKVDVEQAKEVAQEYRVGAIPVMLVFKNEQMVARYNKAMSRKELVEFTKRFL